MSATTIFHQAGNAKVVDEDVIQRDAGTTQHKETCKSCGKMNHFAAACIKCFRQSPSILSQLFQTCPNIDAIDQSCELKHAAYCVSHKLEVQDIIKVAR